MDASTRRPLLAVLYQGAASFIANSRPRIKRLERLIRHPAEEPFARYAVSAEKFDQIVLTSERRSVVEGISPNTVR
jgi:hypothetical protein